MKYFDLLLPLIILALIGCGNEPDKKEDSPVSGLDVFSQYVQDSFKIQVQLPVGYHDLSDTTYPTVYLLDSDFYFPMLAAMLHQYEVVGLLPSLILVGIGYGSIERMDSLRTRDYLYPKALPSDEMETPGGGLNFNRFITEELVVTIDAQYRTQPNNRVLAGHSFGGYFVLFSLLEQLKSESSHFQKFISASPSLWYHDFYLFQLPEKINALPLLSQPQVYLSIGEEEDETWSVKPTRELAKEIYQSQVDSSHFQYRSFNHLDHMDTAILSFIKGFYNK